MGEGEAGTVVVAASPLAGLT
ncbi:hypothetical protein PHAMO_290012 [Magnetospirillum molischianum DSM 120]|uniref:Uncharacterized protein n=1 Tax=Magnetospirillum molischianum DSM 120 TaxID=1150626 RepID=H8FU00_MAGML|nr:hypothetical protein PHAMO_290012 [Magnetospirillum molischianum DSM 120]